jgi:peroxiredoxin
MKNICFFCISTDLPIDANFQWAMQAQVQQMHACCGYRNNCRKSFKSGVHIQAQGASLNIDVS